MRRCRSFDISKRKRKRVAAARGLEIACTTAAVVSVLWFCLHAFASGSAGAEADAVDDLASPFSRPLFRTGNKTPTIYEDSDSYFLETLSHRVVYENSARSVDFLDHSAEGDSVHNADFLGHSVEDNGNAFNLLDDEDAAHMDGNSHAATTMGAGAPDAVGVNVTTSARDGDGGAAFLDVDSGQIPAAVQHQGDLAARLTAEGELDNEAAELALQKKAGWGWGVEVNSVRHADEELERLTTLMATQRDTVNKLENHFNEDKIDPYGQKGHEFKWSGEKLKRYIAQEIWGNVKGHMSTTGTKNIADPNSATAGAGRELWKGSSIGVAMVTNGWTPDVTLKVAIGESTIDELLLLSASSFHPIFTFPGEREEENGHIIARDFIVDPATAVETIAFGVGSDGAYVSKDVAVTSFEFGDIPLEQADVVGTFPGNPMALTLFKLVQAWLGSWDTFAKAFGGIFWAHHLQDPYGVAGAVPGMFKKSQKMTTAVGLPTYIARPWLQSDHLSATLEATLPAVDGFVGHPRVELFNWNILGRGLAHMSMPMLKMWEKEIKNIQTFFQLLALRKKLGEMSARVDSKEVDISVLAFQEDLFAQTYGSTGPDAAGEGETGRSQAEPLHTKIYKGYWTEIIEAHGYAEAFDPQHSWHDGLPQAKREARPEYTLHAASPYAIGSLFSPKKGSKVLASTASPKISAKGTAEHALVMGNTVYIKLGEAFKESPCRPTVAASGWNDRTPEMYSGLGEEFPFRSVAIGFVHCTTGQNEIVAAFPVGHLAGGKFDDIRILDAVLQGYGSKEESSPEEAMPWGAAYSRVSEKQREKLPTSNGKLYYQGAGKLVREMVKTFVKQVYVVAHKLGLQREAKRIPIILPMDMNTKPDMRYFLDEVRKALQQETAAADGRPAEKGALRTAQGIAVEQFRLSESSAKDALTEPQRIVGEQAGLSKSSAKDARREPQGVARPGPEAADLPLPFPESITHLF
ncbi:unnamed protein product [Amoebophrya sp. A25]|nr:unnamed protein product [Amoebophrya sp. A25]|eukprot:GSA25T00026430001.1